MAGRWDNAEIDVTGEWVDVGFHDGDDYDAAMAASNDGDVDKLAEYLAQWDYGQETDDAHTTDGAQWGSDDFLYDVEVGGLEYVISVNHRVGYVSLNRRPLAVQHG
jgi:hypothetical protein